MSEQMTPREIVQELDKFIIGQDEAKRKVAIALRNRWRRQQLPEHLRDEVAPKNIIMIGPTGVGKTEIARRLSKLANAPFVKVEASKFTEVGYVGRDCESMIRELTEMAIHMVRDEMRHELRDRAAELAEERLLDRLLPPQPKTPQPLHPNPSEDAEYTPLPDDAEKRTREVLAQRLREGKLEDREVEVEVRDSASQPMMQVFSNSGLEEMGLNLNEMLGKMMPDRKKRRKVSVAEARKILQEEELEGLMDQEEIVRRAVDRVENTGIVFLDEIDKVAGRGGGQSHGPDVSREGVQRDILPIVEGSTVVTKYGPVKSDHVLFIAAGAFHSAKVADLIPELQGRFPIRVELSALNEADFGRILREPRNSLVRQYQALLGTEEVTVEFSEEAIDSIARICQEVNEQTENIGARRLHTIMEFLLEELSFEAPECAGVNVRIEKEEVERRLKEIREETDVSRYIL
jgi:ATP-dependent HslUV protease ATP-binding subunit HslU